MNSRLIATSLRSLKVQNVSVVGSGLMGAGIAQVAAQTGHNVVLNDLNDAALGKAQAGIEKSLGRVAKKMGDEGPKFVEDTMSRMTFTTSIEETAANADLVVEAIVENLGIKQKLFADLEAAASAQCILATNTSSLPVSAIGANLKDTSRFGGLHFFNPVPMMKLLEVIKANDTSDEVFQAMIDWGKAMNKTTVKCIDTPGFIVNRLLVPYLMEAIRLVERGHATKEDVDIAMKLGAGHPMGPLQLADYVGLDTCKFILDGWHQEYPNEPLFNPVDTLNKLNEEGKIGMKSGEGFYSYKKK
jgi:3-hydroxyacyl-CoA dehydrogenase